ncbi:Alcohol dehydrogenase, class IV [Balnearium lithotrophicum]|uniref:Alcohol dehydrogenase, class IV n=1 Tax=Balnearium lithotrophicum TaxID=223788 RepID=A0A521B2P6_9BACT|nr:iron-containing alcohol dehydrogenase [Balnearium lithotrophicum]SMO41362.1 Alcohol dehydrogenase, class IV [Balnearium lithotrophicum]
MRHFIPTRVVFGRKAVNRLSEEISYLNLNTKRTAVICGSSAVSLGYTKKISEQIEGEVKVFPLVKEDPTVENAEEVLKEVKEFSPTLIVAVGGGSPLDVSKVVSVMLENEGNIREFIGIPEVFKRPGVPLVAVPTTSGSGSEVTPFAVLTDREKLRKAPLISRFLFPALAIDDPELTISMPQFVTANTGIDALTHSIEAFLSKRATPISRLYSLESMKLILNYLPRAFGNPKDIEAREKVMLGSLLGGMAIADAGAGLVHTLAHILGVLYRVPHGLSNGIFLVPVLEFYGLSIKDKLEEIGNYIGMGRNSHGFLNFLKEFLSFLGVPQKASTVGLKEDDISLFISLAMEKKHLMGSLPRIPSERDLRVILEELM